MQTLDALSMSCLYASGRLWVACAGVSVACALQL